MQGQPWVGSATRSRSLALKALAKKSLQWQNERTKMIIYSKGKIAIAAFLGIFVLLIGILLTVIISQKPVQIWSKSESVLFPNPPTKLGTLPLKNGTSTY